jgi:two-component system sensor histidine kinase RpfC
MVIAILMISYCLSMRLITPSDELVEVLCNIATLYLFVAICIVIAISIEPKRYILRRQLTMLFDVGMITWAMWEGGECASMLYVFYLWISLGNGFRYGMTSLYLTSGLSMIGFSIVILSSEFWVDHQVLGGGLLVGLLVTSLYVTLLLKRLENEKLRAEAASKAKSRFLANMSHEIRTPLNGVVGMTDLLAGTPMGIEQREIMRTIQASAETLLNLIEDILDFSKIEAGKVEVSMQDVDIVQFINSILAMMQPSADAKSIKLINSIDMAVPLVIRSDPQLLRQILINLLNNAIKFTDQGSVSLRVTLEQDDDGGEEVVMLLFEIVDTGIGISELQQQHIFERFAQGDDSATRRYSGSGLGTTITKQLVELMGGRIGVESRLGEGSRFWFDLPARPGKLLDDDIHLDEVKVLLFADLLGEGNQVLDYLQDWHMITNVCGSITDGFLELLNAEKMDQPFDLVIIDENQTSLSVEELISAIRAESSMEKLSIICIKDDTQKIEVDGCSAIVTPPVTAEKLQHAIIYALKRRYYGDEVVGARIFKSQSQRVSRQARILLAEDNLINQKVVKKILELQGHVVDVAINGEEAIAMLETKKYDLAIVDLQMPDVGGIDVIKHYREIHFDQEQIPFMILTANATTDAIKQCEEIGVSAYLTKPVRSSHLLEVVSRVLGIEDLNFPANTIIDQPVRRSDAQRSFQVLDLKTLVDLEKLSKDPGFLQNMADSFLRDSDALLMDMQRSLEEGNIHQYRDCAHAIADNASGMGAFSLKTVCSAASGIEQSEFESHGVKMLAKISSTYSITCQALHHYLQQHHQ